MRGFSPYTSIKRIDHIDSSTENFEEGKDCHQRFIADGDLNAHSIELNCITATTACAVVLTTTRHQ